MTEATGDFCIYLSFNLDDRLAGRAFLEIVPDLSSTVFNVWYL
jgi:hypothetical protein